MNASAWWKKLRGFVLLTLVIPLAVLALIEGLVRISGINTEVVKSDRFQVATPLWAADETNFFSAEALYRDIVHHNVPAAAAEWLTCFEEAPGVRYRMRPGIDRRVVNTVNRRELERGIIEKSPCDIFSSNHGCSQATCCLQDVDPLYMQDLLQVFAFANGLFFYAGNLV